VPLAAKSGLPGTAASPGYAYALQERLAEGHALLEEAIWAVVPFSPAMLCSPDFLISVFCM
jgi:hypothetical protein